MDVQTIMLLHTHVARPHTFVPDANVSLMLHRAGHVGRFISEISMVVEDAEAFLVFKLAGSEDTLRFPRRTVNDFVKIIATVNS